MATKIGVIGGSGVYDIDGLEGAEWVSVDSPWGAPSDAILTGTLDGVEMAFLPRHGRGHVHCATTMRVGGSAVRELVLARDVTEPGCYRTRFIAAHQGCLCSSCRALALGKTKAVPLTDRAQGPSGFGRSFD